MIYKNNWLVWQYDGIDFNIKKTPTSQLVYRIKGCTSKIRNYYQELINNAVFVRDTTPGNLDLLLSGGIDSEIVLRVYLDLGIKLNVYIFKYEDNLNYRDVSHALRICQELNLQPKVYKFNLQKFFENDAYDVFSKSYPNSSGRLPQMKIASMVDNIPLIASGDPYWRKVNDQWVLEFDEDARSWARYFIAIDRPAVCDWYEASQELMISHIQTEYMQNLFANRIPGKTSYLSSKVPLHQQYWPSLVPRPKLVGFEGNKEASRQSKPNYMIEFEKQYIDGKVKNRIDHITLERFLFINKYNGYLEF